MKTQISITVKKENPLSQLFSGNLLWFINVLKKSCIYVSIDNSAAQTLEARSEPYVFDVAPGPHVVAFADPTAKGKQAGRAVTGAALGATFGSAMNAGAMNGAVAGMNAVGVTIRDDTAQFYLNDGDQIKLQVQANIKGGVKVKQI